MDRMSEDFRYINGEGKFSVKEQFRINTTRQTDSELSDLKVRQNGNLGVISGIHTTNNKQADGSNKPNHTAFTYTIQKTNGKWLFVNSQQTPVK